MIFPSARISPEIEEEKQQFDSNNITMDQKYKKELFETKVKQSFSRVFTNQKQLAQQQRQQQEKFKRKKKKLKTEVLIQKNSYKNHQLFKLLLFFYFYSKYIIFPCISLIGTLLCIISLFFWNLQYIDSNYALPYNTLLLIDLIVGITFSLELIPKIQNILEFENILSLALIIRIFYRILDNLDYEEFFFFDIIRAIQVAKLRFFTLMVYTNFKKFVLKTSNDDLVTHYYEDQTELNKFIIDSLIQFISGIIIESTYFLAFEHYFWDQKPFNLNYKMGYVDAIYYTVVSISTIGYGEIFPTITATRLAVSFALIINITIMSNFLGKFIELLFLISPYDRVYSFNDHIVIIGIDKSQVQELMNELVENDKVQKKLKNESQLNDGTKTIIVLNEDPDEQLRRISIYYTEQYGNELVFLRQNAFSGRKNWITQSNLKEARILLGYQNGHKLLPFIAIGVKESFPDLRILLVIDNNNQMEDDSLFNGIEIFSPEQFNHTIMSLSLENFGIGTILQHLLTMKEKNISNSLLEHCEHDQFMLRYISDMQQELYPIKLPDFFHGMTFQECCELLYLYGLELGKQEIQEGKFIQDSMHDDRKMTLVAIETRKKKSISTENKDRSIHSDRVSENEEMFPKQSTSDQEEESVLLINPQEHKIQVGDIAYVICEDQEVASEALEIISKNCDKYIKYLQNYMGMHHDLQVKRESSELINRMFETLKEQKENFEIKRKDPKSQIRNFNLFDVTKTFVRFKNHFVIFGKLQEFRFMIQVLRQHSERPIVLFNDNEDIDQAMWNEIEAINEKVFYIQGDYLNYDHLDQLNLPSAHKILIMSQLISNVQFPDAIGICLIRILLDHYDRNDFLIELWDDSKIEFLNKNPRLKSIQTPHFFYPSFVSGQVHFSSMATAMIARTIYSKQWLRLFQDLTQQSEKKAQNKNIRLIKMNKEAAQNFKFFGQLFYALLQKTPSIIAIGMIKYSFGSSKYEEKLVDEFLAEGFIMEVEQMFRESDLTLAQNSQKEVIQEVEKIIAKILGNKLILTNPSFYTLLEEKDEILVLGDLNKTKQSKDELELQIDELFQNLESQQSVEETKYEGKILYSRLIKQIKCNWKSKSKQVRLNQKNAVIQELKRKYDFNVNYFEQYL